MKSNTTISVEEQNDIQVKDGEKETGEVMLQTVENVMSRLLAAELNHFYLNMATKTDYSMKHLETLLASKLRKIEIETKHSNPYGSSGIWKGIFDPVLSRASVTNVPGSSGIPGTNLAPKSTCLDPSASNTLQEVKQLLRTLMSKGEDLRRTLTEQANEGVDLLKHLHQSHQFNKKQLEEVRQLIEEMNKEEQSQNITILSAWNPLNVSGNQFETDRYTKLANINIFDKFKSSVLEANITEEKIRGVLKRIGDVEEKLQTLDLSSGNAKNVIDELLTSTKDLKNYSKDQIFLLDAFQNDIIKFVNISKTVGVKTLSKKFTKHPKFLSDLNDAESNQMSPSCYHSLLNIFNSTAILSYPDNTVFSIKNITNLFQAIINNQRNKLF
ncbi:hypothetical protein Avbf_08612 [Armadillidium vulgare]|nr:hypothetical protein Avbf_08612 [Armadillidium vulgare]